MSHDSAAGRPADEPGAARDVASPSSGSREVGPGLCADCEAAVPAGARFCPACRSHLLAPDAGRLASARRRLGAAFLDSLLKEGGLLGRVLWPVIMPGGTATVIVAAMSIVYWAAALVLWSRGTTPAKRLLQMKVVTEDGEPAGFFRMAFRETIAKWISTVALGLGLLAIPRDEEKRGWHDRMAGTWVLYEDE